MATDQSITVTLDYNGAKKRFRLKGNDFQAHLDTISNNISSRFKKTLNQDVSIAVNDTSITSSNDLENCINGQAKVTIFVKV